jgi:hypothetical protein
VQRHSDPDVIALRAIGEAAGDEEQITHLAECSQCAAELEELRHVATIVQEEDSMLSLEHPPARVWERIQAELQIDPSSPTTDQPPLALSDASAPFDAGSLVEPEHAAPAPDSVPAQRGGTSKWVLALAAGVTGIAVGGLGVSLWDGAGDADQQVVAQTELEPLPDWPGSSGQANVVQVDGSQVLEVSVADTAAADGYQEVWLIDTNVEGMISLGVLEGEDGQFVIPTGIDVGDFPIVDISLEPTDGKPEHSGNSIVRGVLDV